MDGLRFYVLFNSISVKSGQWSGNNESAQWNLVYILRLERTLSPALNPRSCRGSTYIYGFLLIINSVFYGFFIFVIHVYIRPTVDEVPSVYCKILFLGHQNFAVQ